jgi:hypothetical protein
MAEVNLVYGTLKDLSSTSGELNVIVENLGDQESILLNQINLTQKLIHQLRIGNMYKAHENDFIIDENIFENDELD